MCCEYAASPSSCTGRYAARFRLLAKHAVLVVVSVFIGMREEGGRGVPSQPTGVKGDGDVSLVADVDVDGGPGGGAS